MYGREGGYQVREGGRVPGRGGREGYQVRERGRVPGTERGRVPGTGGREGTRYEGREGTRYGREGGGEGHQVVKSKLFPLLQWNLSIVDTLGTQ